MNKQLLESWPHEARRNLSHSAGLNVLGPHDEPDDLEQIQQI